MLAGWPGPGWAPGRLIGEKRVRALCPAGGRRLDRSHSKGPFLAGPPEAPPVLASPSRSSAAIQTCAIRLAPRGDAAQGPEAEAARAAEQRERRRAAKEEEMLRLAAAAGREGEEASGAGAAARWAQSGRRSA